jgi:hypothetical protein
MNKQELMKAEQQRHAKAYKIIKSLPNTDKVHFMNSDGTVFMRTSESFGDLLNLQSCFDQEFLEYRSCYMNGNSLAIRYHYKFGIIVFFCREADIALKELVGDQCSIEEEEQVVREKAVVCNL